VRRKGDRVVISVTDHGVGIPKAEQKKIFEKFYRVENTLIHTTKGSGLGLALVQHITEAHGGSIEVESEAGEGSTFRLLIPLSPPARITGGPGQQA
jgi:signal transduction histidine kinase